MLCDPFRDLDDINIDGVGLCDPRVSMEVRSAPHWAKSNVDPINLLSLQRFAKLRIEVSQLNNGCVVTRKLAWFAPELLVQSFYLTK